MMTLDEAREEARIYFNGDVRRVLTIVRVAVACRGPKEAADFCRRLKRHPQVCVFRCLFRRGFWCWRLPFFKRGTGMGEGGGGGGVEV